MRILKATTILSILPLLSGCITSSTIDAAKAPATNPVPDKVYHVEKAVISKGQQMVIYLEGCLTNSSQRSRFTVSVSLEQIRTKAETWNMLATNKTFALLKVSRSAIRTGWIPEESSVENLETIPVGAPIPTPIDIPGRNYYGFALAEYAKLLPNTTQTLYPVIEQRNFNRTDWPARLEFVYVDASSKQACTIIHVNEFTIPSNRNKVFYGFLPVTVPLDIVTAPIQFAWYLLVGYAWAHGHS